MSVYHGSSNCFLELCKLKLNKAGSNLLCVQSYVSVVKKKKTNQKKNVNQ